MEWLKKLLCSHGNMKIVEDYTWIRGATWYIDSPSLRKYLVCPKCGFTKKITKK